MIEDANLFIAFITYYILYDSNKYKKIFSYTLTFLLNGVARLQVRVHTILKIKKSKQSSNNIMQKQEHKY